MAEISRITLPSGTTYTLKDETARQAISGGVSYAGVTTTPLSDGATTESIVIGANTVTAINGMLAIYDKSEFIFSASDSKWHEFGDISSLGALAYKDAASGSFTPSGTVSQPSFTGSSSSVTITAADNASGNYQPKGTVSKPSFTGTAFTSSGKYTPSGDVSLSTTNKTATVSAATSGTATYTPSGNVSAPTISVATQGTTSTIRNPTKQTVAKTVVTAAPGTTAPANAVVMFSVTEETLSLYQLGYTTGDSITTSNVTVKTGDASYEATAPSFTGDGVRLVTGNIPVPSSASFSGTEGDVSVSGTPTGTVSQPTFTGTKVQISGTVTPQGTVSQPTFTGNAGNVTVS